MKSYTHIENYFLDLKKILLLEKEQAQIINEYFRDMISNYEDNRYKVAEFIFNSLLGSEYLINKRETKINEIIHGDDSIS